MCMHVMYAWLTTLQEVIRRSPHILTLDVSHNGLTDRATHVLAEAMAAPACRLQRLALSCNRLTAASVELLLQHCRGAPTDGIARTASAAAAAARSPAQPPDAVVSYAPLQLLHIDLSGNPIGDHGVKLISAEVCTGGGRCCLQTLVVRFPAGMAHPFEHAFSITASVTGRAPPERYELLGFGQAETLPCIRLHSVGRRCPAPCSCTLVSLHEAVHAHGGGTISTLEGRDHGNAFDESRHMIGA